MPLLRRLKTIAAKVESVIGTAESLTAAEGVYNAYDIKIDADLSVEQREAQGSFDSLPGVPGSRAGSMSFKTDAGWDGALLPSWASVLLPCCGYVAAAQVFTPRSEYPGSNVKTATIGVFMNGMYKVLAGAMGNFKINAPAGKIISVEWDFKGVWQAVTDSALIAPTYPTYAAIRFGSAVLTYATVAQCVENVTFDAGNEIILRECPSTAAGFISAAIVDRKPTISFNPEAELVATDDRYGAWLAGTQSAFSCQFDGPVGIVTNANMILSAPKAQIMTIAESERNKLATDDVNVMCQKNGATKDQDVSITFTDLADA